MQPIVDDEFVNELQRIYAELKLKKRQLNNFVKLKIPVEKSQNRLEHLKAIRDLKLKKNEDRIAMVKSDCELKIKKIEERSEEIKSFFEAEIQKVANLISIKTQRVEAVDEVDIREKIRILEFDFKGRAKIYEQYIGEPYPYSI